MDWQTQYWRGATRNLNTLMHLQQCLRHHFYRDIELITCNMENNLIWTLYEKPQLSKIPNLFFTKLLNSDFIFTVFVEWNKLSQYQGFFVPGVQGSSCQWVTHPDVKLCNSYMMSTQSTAPGADLTNKRGKRPLRAPGNQGPHLILAKHICSVDVAVHRNTRWFLERSDQKCLSLNPLTDQNAEFLSSAEFCKVGHHLIITKCRYDVNKRFIVSTVGPKAGVPGLVAFPLSLPGLDRASSVLPLVFFGRRKPWAKAGQLGLEEWLWTKVSQRLESVVSRIIS